MPYKFHIIYIYYIIHIILECILDTSTHGESSVAIRISFRSFVIPGFGRMPVRARRGFTMDFPMDHLGISWC